MDGRKGEGEKLAYKNHNQGAKKAFSQFSLLNYLPRIIHVGFTSAFSVPFLEKRSEEEKKYRS